MKELHGTASARTFASPQRCLELLAAVERYPSWYPEVVRRVEVVDRDADGAPASARTTLHVAQGPFVREIQLLLALELDPPHAVKLVRIPHHVGDAERFAVTWRVSPDGDGSRIDLALDASLSVPRLVPLGGVGNSVAGGFVQAAARELEASR